MSKFFARIALFLAATLLFSYLAIYKIERDVLKHKSPEDLTQTAVIPAAWRPHQLNITYGKGGSPETEKHSHTHNQQGFKYPRDISKEKPKNIIRVFAMGGSTLYGWGSEGLARYGNWPHLSNDETITHFLERDINNIVHKEHPDIDVEIINAAIIDYNSAFHLVYYNQVIWQYHPDALIFLDGNNEFWGMYPFNSFTEYQNTGVNVINGFNGRAPYYTLYVLSRYLAQYSNFFDAMQYKALDLWLTKEAPTVNKIYELPDSFENFNTNYDARARLFLRTYTQLKAAADFDGIGTALFLGPQMLLEDSRVLGEKDTRTLDEVHKDWGDKKVSREEFMRRARARLPALFKEIHFPFFDVSQLGAKKNIDKQLYIDYTHVTPSGAEVLAGRMLEPTLDLVNKAIAKRLLEDAGLHK